MDLIDKLQKMTDPDYRSKDGICGDLNDEELDHIIQLFRQWPEYSGVIEVPVPDYVSFRPREAYMNSTSEEMWSPDHPYGAARRRLLAFLIESLTGASHL